MKHPSLRSRYYRLRNSIVLTIALSLILIQCKDSIFNSTTPETSISGTDISDNNSLSIPSLSDGALYEIKLPEEWDDLVIYNHGFINPQKPLAVPDDEVEGQLVSGIINELGFAYAATSYRANGLVGPEAVNDVVQLVETFVEMHGEPDHIYLIGVSEGALITTLAVEQHGGIFSGGIAACGPVGDFERQLKYLGDFHVLFNYYFPGLIPGDPSGVPDVTINDWLSDNSALQQEVADAINNNQPKARTLLKVARVPVDNSSDPEELRSTIFSLLRYNVLATNNANQRLNGLPYSNDDKFYRGTGSFLSDLRLNHNIERFTADASALSTIVNEFQTSGDLSRPLVMTHTTGDQEVPYWHEPLYRFKTFFAGSSLLHSNIPVVGRYGHCNFELSELLTSFGVMILKVTLQDLVVPNSVFESEQQKQEFLNLSGEHGIDPKFRETSLPALQ